MYHNREFACKYYSDVAHWIIVLKKQIKEKKDIFKNVDSRFKWTYCV